MSRIIFLTMVAVLFFGQPNSPVFAQTLPAPKDITDLSKDEKLAQTLALLTGVPISPLLGISALSAYQYFKTPGEHRSGLPWYRSPWFWGIGLLISLLFALNTFIGSIAPPLKKPMDLVEVFEDKVSFLIASPIVAIQVAIMVTGLLNGDNPNIDATTSAPAAVSTSLVQTSDTASVTNPQNNSSVPPLVSQLLFGGSFIISMLMMSIVWIVSHIFSILIFLSPWGVLDMGLRTVRTGILGAIVMSSAIHPYLGAVVAGIVFLITLLLAGWSFRLSLYGTVLCLDAPARLFGLTNEPELPLYAFTARRLNGVPVRTFGRTDCAADNQLCFKYRKWWLLPEKTVLLPGPLAIGKGLVSPTLLDQNNNTLLTFPPRYRSHEAKLADLLKISAIRETGALNGLKTIKTWFKDLLGTEKSQVAAV